MYGNDYTSEYSNAYGGVGDYYEEYYGTTSLGLLLPAAGGIVSAIGSIFGGNPKDAGRIATNTRAYNQAVSGHDGTFYGDDGSVAAASGLEFLRVHSVAGDADGGWATATATKDALSKYQKALSVVGQKTGATPAGVPSTGAYPPSTGGSVSPLLLVGALAIGAVMLSGKKRR